MSDKLFDLTDKRVWVAGHRGFLGSALVRRLTGYAKEVLTTERDAVDLTSMTATYRWVRDNVPDVIIVAAGRVGGIQANAKDPVRFFNENVGIGTNLANIAALLHVPKLVYLGAPCVYPRDCTQPMREDHLMSGPLEPTNEAYAMAKLSTMALARFYRQQYGHDFISVIPTNLYGPGDSLDPDKNHVIPALIEKILQAKRTGGAVTIWGSGKPVREFMHVDDAADGIVFATEHYSSQLPINVASGEAVSIKQLFEMLALILKFDGTVTYDRSKPDGMPRKQLNGHRMFDFGWKPRQYLNSGLIDTCAWIKKELEKRNTCA